MTEIVGVGFMKTCKVYYFDPEGEKYSLGENVIVETSRGMEMGHIQIANRLVEDDDIVAPLKPIKRRACEEDLEKYRENLERRDHALEICKEKIQKHELEMKLIDAEFMIDGSKLVFYFSADGRVDFRNLAKDLASYFKIRIELRQIGVRDEAKMLGGIGICGRPLCCNKWLHDFQPVSIKMAKQQNLSLNPSKISGSCGRLMCCLNYETSTYKELRKGMPNDNERIETPDGLAKVVNVDYFKGVIQTRAIERDKETGEEVFSPEIKIYTKDEIKRHFNSKTIEEPEVLDEETAREIEELTRD